MHQGKVKWFNDKKGYGFISMDNGQDVFVHCSNIHWSRGNFPLLQGETVTFKIVDGEKGPQAANVQSLSFFCLAAGEQRTNTGWVEIPFYAVMVDRINWGYLPNRGHVFLVPFGTPILKIIWDRRDVDKSVYIFTPAPEGEYYLYDEKEANHLLPKFPDFVFDWALGEAQTGRHQTYCPPEIIEWVLKKK